MARPHDAAFDRFVAGGSHALLRLATLFTQDHGHAEDLVDLVWTYLSSMEGAEDAYTYDSLALAARAATSVVLGRFTSFEPGTGAAPVDGVLVVMN